MENGRITYTQIETPIGTVVAAASSRGCCLLEFVENGEVDDLPRTLGKRHRADVAPGTNDVLEQLERELQAYFGGALKRFTVPIDIQGTPFQQSVWRQLLQVPFGETRSYAQLAIALKNPKAMRAVGAANGKNPVAIVIPCHRIVQADGTLGGYGGGLWRKEFLLNLEGIQVGSRTPGHPHTAVSSR